MAHRFVARITLAAIRQLEPGEEVRDTELKGFGARRQVDQVSYFLHRRMNGRLRRLTIGAHGSPWTPELARKEALRLIVAANSGVDVGDEKRRQRAEAVTVAETAESFLSDHGKRLKPRTRETYEILIRRQIVPVLGARRIGDIVHKDVARLHSHWSEMPRTANHAVAVLSKLMSWAEEQGLRMDGSNPCRKIAKYKEQKRERFLSVAELARLGAALGHAAETQSQNRFVLAAIWLLILTGARLNEILTLRWSYVDWERRSLQLPDSKTGAKAIALNEPALDVLRKLGRVDGNPFVLPGHIHGTHLVNIQKPWRALRALAGLEDVRLHDLRHSFASAAVLSGGSLPVIGKLLGHLNTQTTARYAHVSHDPAAELSEVTAQHIFSAMTGGGKEKGSGE